MTDFQGQINLSKATFLKQSPSFVNLIPGDIKVNSSTLLAIWIY